MLKLAVTMAALGWALSRTSLSAMRDAVGRMSPAAPIAAVLLLAGGIVAGAFRWREVMRAYGVDRMPPLAFLIRGYLVAGFYNTLVLGNVGGDVLRGYAARGAFEHPADSYIAILVERGFGLVALLALAAVGASLGTSLGAPLAIVFVGLGVALLAVTMATPRLVQTLSRWLPGRLGSLAREPTSPRNYGALFVAALWSIPSQLTAICATHVLVHGIEPRLQLIDSLALIPIASLVTYVPISLAGLGLREAAFVVLLGKVGVAPGDATAASLAFMGVLLFVAVVGGVAHAIQPLRLPRDGGDVR